MKVLVTWHGAVEPAYRTLFDELAALGAEVLLIAPAEWTEAGRPQRFSGCKGAYSSIAFNIKFKDRIRGFFYPDAPGILKQIKAFRPDILHIMEEPFSLAASEFLMLKRLSGSKARTILFSFENIAEFRQKLPYSLFQSCNLKNADAIITVPEEGLGIWRSRGFGGKVARIPLGIDLGLYKRISSEKAFAEAGVVHDGSFVIGYSGRIAPEKGLDTLIKAVSLLAGKGKKVRAYLAGGGGHKDALIKEAKAFGVDDSIRFLGPMEQSKLPAFYSSIDALVLPSRTTGWWKEQFGRVLPEAMACGTPVVGSSSGEIPNVIGEAGLVFPEGDEGALSESIGRLIEDNRLREGLVKKGIERANSEFSWKSVAGKYLALYRELAAGN